MASLQQVSLIIMGFVLFPKTQCIRVSLNLISTPSTLSCRKKKCTNHSIGKQSGNIRDLSTFSLCCSNIVLNIYNWTTRSGAQQFQALNTEKLGRKNITKGTLLQKASYGNSQKKTLTHPETQ